MMKNEEQEEARITIRDRDLGEKSGRRATLPDKARMGIDHQPK